MGGALYMAASGYMYCFSINGHALHSSPFETVYYTGHSSKGTPREGGNVATGDAPAEVDMGTAPRESEFHSRKARAFLPSRGHAATDEMESCPFTAAQLEAKAARLGEICEVYEATGRLGDTERAELPGLTVYSICIM